VSRSAPSGPALRPLLRRGALWSRDRPPPPGAGGAPAPRPVGCCRARPNSALIWKRSPAVSLPSDRRTVFALRSQARSGQSTVVGLRLAAGILSGAAPVADGLRESRLRCAPPTFGYRLPLDAIGLSSRCSTRVPQRQQGRRVDEPHGSRYCLSVRLEVHYPVQQEYS